MLKLRFKNNKHNAVWLVEPKVCIGRNSANDLVVDDVAVAEKHAEIYVADEKLTLKNVSGGQPLYVNRTAVSDSAPVNLNDVITLGKIQLQVVDPKREPKAAPTVVRSDGATGWALKANHSALSNRIFALKDVTVVGRSSECDITLAAAHLSRRHAKLVVKDGLLYVKDLGSSNGTYLNGKRISEGRVKRGDDLRFDTLSFGVIGPADDLDKTTVRSVRGAKAAPSTPKAARTKVVSTSGTPRKAAVGSAARKAPVTPQSATVAVQQEPKSGGGSSALLVFGVLLVLLLGALVAYQGDIF